jgi:outer membrane biosynthesis protein TonB
MDIELIILVVGALAVAIAFFAIREDKQNKEIQRLVDNAIDRDNDGWVLEGTPLATYRGPKKKAVVKKKTVAKKKPAKKAVAKKKAAPVKKKPVKKVVKKKAVAPKKKKAVAKKKSR